MSHDGIGVGVTRGGGEMNRLGHALLISISLVHPYNKPNLLLVECTCLCEKECVQFSFLIAGDAKMARAGRNGLEMTQSENL